MGRHFLAHREDDAINAVLATQGYYFQRLIQWLRLLLGFILHAIAEAPDTLNV